MKGSLYSVSDKAMFDAINQSKVTNAELKELFLSRGIIISHATKREHLAMHFSRFTHSYSDYKRLADILGTNTRREKNTSTRINEKIDTATLEEAIGNLIGDIEHYGGECSLDSVDNNRVFNLKVNYDEFNYSAAEFRQVTKKEANISIEKTENGLVIRHPQNKTVDEWKAQLIAKIEQEMEQDVETSDISLSHVSDHRKITEFFEVLIEGIDGHKLYDVTDVYVYHPKEEEVDFTDDDTNESKIDLGTHISKAALKGQNVLQSEVLSEFYAKGFYISKVVWKTKVEGSIDEDIYEFEAQFSDADNKDYFSYLAKGYYSYKSDGEYFQSRKALSSLEERKMNQQIEKAAQAALQKISAL